MYKASVVALFLLSVGLVLSGCTKKTEDTGKQSKQHEVNQGSAPALPSAVAGIRWMVPSRWIPQPERPMRAATYSVPPANKDLEAGECAVFYFGSGQGGNVNDNLNRWISQFDKGGTHELKDKEISGMRVKLIEIRGTYLAPSGPMMESQGKKENYRLLGAIISAPEGSVFFKFTGPEKTIEASSQEFDQLVSSVTKN
jgi:hypothetical protein